MSGTAGAWYEFDVSYLTIRLLARLGLVWGVRTPSPEVLAGGATLGSFQPE